MNGGDESDSLKGYRYYRRSFLNRPGYHATAFILATVSFTKAEDEHGCFTDLVIADCSRSISLSIDADDDGSAANSLYKLDTLIRTLTEFRDAFKQECEVQKVRERRKNQVKILTT